MTLLQRRLIMCLLVLIICCIGSIDQNTAVATGQTTVSGQLETAWTDMPGSTHNEVLHYLRTGTGERYRIAEDVEALQPGSSISADIVSATAVNIQQQPDLASSARYSNYPATGTEHWISLICETSTSRPVTRDYSYFDGMYPILDDYLNRTSFGALNIEGYITGTFKLTNPSSFYTQGEYGWERGSYTFAEHCYAEAKRNGVNFADISGIQFILNDLPTQASIGGLFCPQNEDCYRATWLVSWSYQDIHVVAHEILHSYGLPHSSGVNRSLSGNPFDVMSDTWSCMVPHPVYNCLPQYTIAYFRNTLKWLPDSRVQTLWATNTGVYTITMDTVSEPNGTDNPLMVLIYVPYDYNTKVVGYTLENRKQVGIYDAGLPESGIVVGQIQSSYDRWVLLQNRHGMRALEPGRSILTPHMEVCVNSENPDGSMNITIAIGNRCRYEVMIPLLHK